MIPAFVNPLAGNADDARGGAARGRRRSTSARCRPKRSPITFAPPSAKEPTRILVAGGDGTIGSAAGALAGTGVELAILPCGTLNHLAKDLALPLGSRGGGSRWRSRARRFPSTRPSSTTASS